MGPGRRLALAVFESLHLVKNRGFHRFFHPDQARLVGNLCKFRNKQAAMKLVANLAKFRPRLELEAMTGNIEFKFVADDQTDDSMRLEQYFDEIARLASQCATAF